MDSIKFGSSLQNSISADSLETLTQFDDIYFDDSYAHVTLGNNNTLASSTHRETQLLTAWAAGEITITFNQGTFVADESAYLFVIDSDGTASAGFPVTIGGEASVELTAPTVLTVSGGNP